MLGTVLTPFSCVHRLWCCVGSTVCFRLILFFSGFYSIKTEIVSLRRRGTASSPTFSVASGDIIVSNWTSYIDLLYMAYKWNPIFTRVFPAQSKVQIISLWQAIQLCAAVPVLSCTELGIHPNDLWTLSALAKKAKQDHLGPILVLPEGTPSNGRALLQFNPIFKDLQPNDKDLCFHIMGLK
ncbi:hypothetical protein BDF14DRAFT_1798866 [Spinellus fusiger]|nr:hypothetical protein BDF14DRAFT_1798866 [Spinellus fusiger]